MTKIAGTRVIDIAQEAGVSIATVDRVLNKRKGVRSMTAERVWQAVERLGDDQRRVAGKWPDRRTLRLDFVLPRRAGPNIENLQQALQEAGPMLGAETHCHMVERLDPAALAKTIRALADDADGVGFVALEHPLVREAVEDLAARGVPAVTIMSDLASTGRLAYIGVDNRAAGRTAGYLMGRFLHRSGGKVAILAGSSLYRNHEEREMGFRSVLREQFPALETLDLVVGQDHPEANYSQTSALLDRHPDLIGIYSIGSGNRGVVKALREHGRDRAITLIVHNLTAISRQFLLDGAVDALIHQDVAREAELAVRILLNGSTGGDTSVNTLPVQIIVRENIAQ